MNTAIKKVRRMLARGGSDAGKLQGRAFILGVGAQKSGTSWLYRYLADHPDCAMPETKELHVFDAAFQPETFAKFRNDAATDLLEAIGERRRGGTLSIDRGFDEACLRLRAVHDVSRYMDIFRDMPGGQVLTGEITPSYAALTSKQFTRVREILLAEGVRPKVVFLMRDPVERLYSAARMEVRWKKASPQEARALTLRYLDQPAQLARGRYDQTVQALDANFEPDELFYGFFEDLFTKATMRGLCEFLGIAYVDPAFGVARNTTNRAGDLLPEQHAVVRARLAPVYDFCRARFGERVPQGWAE